MTTYQILSLLALTVALLGVYGQTLIGKIRWPTRSPKPGILSAIEAVVAVRDQYTDPEVTAACNSLLAALLKVAK
ncbi:MAG: hypothetical protein EBR82_72445 [Caulobacteraceae bacterium]|nr:hypothetical protein [Caulobacteraceae bacterium]